MTDISTAPPCSTQSVEAAEQLFGTASTNEVWFLLEYSRPWGAKVLPESDLSAPVKDHLQAQLKAVPKSNMLFIKQPGQPQRITFYIAIASEHNPRLYRFPLNTYDDLLTLDMPAILRGDSAFDSYQTVEPLYLVCTNAQRDRCCGRYGLPIYRELIEQVGGQVWQCSHLGGHRFAPTMLFFPHGICYGRVHESELDEIIAHYEAGQLYLRSLRGRSCYEPVVQAAEYYLRQQTRLLDIAAYTLESATYTETLGQWQVRFSSRDTQSHYSLNLKQVITDKAIQNSCFAEELTPIKRYELVNIT